jgi:hypothetical protein
LEVSATELWQTRYEHLRAQVLEARGTVSPCGCGYVLLLQRGLAAWMKAWPATPSPVAPLPEPISEQATAQDATSLPWLIEQQLAQILADTILGHVQETGS